MSPQSYVCCMNQMVKIRIKSVVTQKLIIQKADICRLYKYSQLQKIYIYYH